MKPTIVHSAKSRGLRHGWDDAFKAMAAAGDDNLLLPDTLATESDEAEWTW